jgi:hypothetical protein
MSIKFLSVVDTNPTYINKTVIIVSAIYIIRKVCLCVYNFHHYLHQRQIGGEAKGVNAFFVDSCDNNIRKLSYFMKNHEGFD